MVVIMVIVGASGPSPSPSWGAVFIEGLSELLRAWGEVRMVLFALLVTVVARAYPPGLAGLCQAAGPRLAARIPPLAPVLTPQKLGD